MAIDLTVKINNLSSNQIRANHVEELGSNLVDPNPIPSSSWLSPIKGKKILMHAVIGGVICGLITAVALGILFGPFGALIGITSGLICGLSISVSIFCFNKVYSSSNLKEKKQKKETPNHRLQILDLGEAKEEDKRC